MRDKHETVIEYELREIDTVSTFKIVFLITLTIGILIAIIQAAAFLAGGKWEWAGGTLFMLPIFAALQGAFILVVAWLYNLFAHRFGGIKMRWRAVEENPTASSTPYDNARTNNSSDTAVSPVN